MPCRTFCVLGGEKKEEKQRNKQIKMKKVKIIHWGATRFAAVKWNFVLNRHFDVNLNGHRTFARVLSDVYAKLNGVSGEDLTGRALLWAATQPLAVDEGPVAAFSVLQVELRNKSTTG